MAKTTGGYDGPAGSKTLDRDIDRDISRNEADAKTMFKGNYMNTLGKEGIKRQQEGMRRTAQDQGGYGTRKAVKKQLLSERGPKRVRKSLSR